MAEYQKQENRAGFTRVYHELFDLYHPYIGDSAVFYYTYLLRYRNNEVGSHNYGKCWVGRNRVTKKFKLGKRTLQHIDAFLEAAELVKIERYPSHNGEDKIFYTVKEPLPLEEFQRIESKIISNLRAYIASEPDAKGLLGKAKRGSI